MTVTTTGAATAPAPSKVLITGGAGFIGSTVASACSAEGITPVVLDDLSTGRAEFAADRIFYRGDIADAALLERIVTDHPEIDVTVHCAARTIVPDSVADPLGYYDVNVARTLAMLSALRRLGRHQVVFSSSAAVYGNTDTRVVDETTPLAPATPYATAKAMIEQVLTDLTAAGQISALSLRYFNPIGADPQLRTGPPYEQPSHVLGRMLAADRAGLPFTITGTDWPTRDGTGVRDYVHVWDIARAHVAAIRRLPDLTAGPERHRVLNLGSGVGTTVRELVAAFTGVTGRPMEVREAARRPGDTAGCWTNVEKARQLLGWAPEATLEQGISHALRWVDTATRRFGAAGPLTT